MTVAKPANDYIESTPGSVRSDAEGKKREIVPSRDWMRETSASDLDLVKSKEGR